MAKKNTMRTSKTHILGLPIEGRTGTIAEALVTTKKVKTPRVPKAPAIYSGPKIPCTKAYRRDMPEFKNCKAECWMLINEKAETYTFANTYNGLLKSSFQAEHSTYQLTPKNHKKVLIKAERMIEVEADELPEWATTVGPVKAAPAKRGRKAK